MPSAAGVLDPFVRHYVADGKGGADWRPMRGVAHRLVIGAEDESIQQFVAMLDELITKMGRRFTILGTLPTSVCPEGKLTLDISRRYDLPVIFIAIDELQEYLSAMTAAVREDAVDKLARLARQARYDVGDFDRLDAIVRFLFAAVRIGESTAGAVSAGLRPRQHRTQRVAFMTTHSEASPAGGGWLPQPARGGLAGRCGVVGEQVGEDACAGRVDRPWHPLSTLCRLRSQLSGSTPGGIVPGGGRYARSVGARGAGQCEFEQISAGTGCWGSWCGVAAAWGGSAGLAGLCCRWARVGMCTVVGCARGWLSGVVTRWRPSDHCSWSGVGVQGQRGVHGVMGSGQGTG